MNDQLIVSLMELWGDTIGCQHHKSSDFVVRIEKEFRCFEGKPKYNVLARGYILHHLPEYIECETHEEALQCLGKILIDAIKEECETAISYETTPENYYDLSKERACEILEKLEKLRKIYNFE